MGNGCSTRTDGYGHISDAVNPSQVTTESCDRERVRPSRSTWARGLQVSSFLIFPQTCNCYKKQKLIGLVVR